MNNYIVYTHISPSGKRYIGITCQKPEYRWNNGRGYIKNKHFYRAINKYGWDNFEHIIIARSLSEEEAKWLEIELIREFDSTNQEKGYNITLGGEGSNGRKLSDEEKKEISKRTKGENNPMYGKVGILNPKSKSIVMFDKNGVLIKEFESIKQANDYFNKPRAFSFISAVCLEKRGSAYNHFFLFKEEYEKMIIKNTFSIWLRNKKNEINKVNVRRNKEEENKNREVYQLEIGTYKIIKKYNSCYDASIKLNLRNIYKVAIHEENRNTAGGYHWMFVDEYEKLSIDEINDIYINKHLLEETGEKISKALKGKYCGKNNFNSKPVICLTTKRIFYTTTEGVKYYNCSNHISECCKGKIKSCGKLPDGTKLVWRFIEIIEL